jgi:hypothetical protein
MGIACPLSHIGPLEAVVAGHQLAILVRDVAKPARSVSLVTSNVSSQTIGCHVGLFRAVLTSEGTPAHSRGVKDILLRVSGCLFASSLGLAADKGPLRTNPF